MAPSQETKCKLFALQFTKMDRGNSLFRNMLGGITTKVCIETSFGRNINYFHLPLPRKRSVKTKALNNTLAQNTIFLFQQKDRTMAYIDAFLREAEDRFSPEEKELRTVVEEFLKNVEEQKCDNSDSDCFLEVIFRIESIATHKIHFNSLFLDCYPHSPCFRKLAKVACFEVINN